MYLQLIVTLFLLTLIIHLRSAKSCDSVKIRTSTGTWRWFPWKVWLELTMKVLKTPFILLASRRLINPHLLEGSSIASFPTTWALNQSPSAAESHLPLSEKIFTELPATSPSIVKVTHARSIHQWYLFMFACVLDGSFLSRIRLRILLTESMPPSYTIFITTLGLL